MMQLMKPRKLNKGDKVALISPSWGCAGAPRVIWKYKSGCERLEQIGLKVIPAPNSLKGTKYLKNSPKARAEDIMWAFANPEIKAIICNIGGNDSETLLEYLNPEIIKNNPKIFCGYSDAMSLHLYFFQLGLMTYYGDNLLTTIAEQNGWHEYSKDAFINAFFHNDIVGRVLPAKEVSYSANNHVDANYRKEYVSQSDYKVVQGIGDVKGHLIGGHGGIVEYKNNSIIQLEKNYFENAILFFEDIEEICNMEYLQWFFDELGKKGWLQVLNGIVIGAMKIGEDFERFSNSIKQIISNKYGMKKLPVIYGLNIGHISPIFIMPYGAEAMISIKEEKCCFEIGESMVL